MTRQKVAEKTDTKDGRRVRKYMYKDARKTAHKIALQRALRAYYLGN